MIQRIIKKWKPKTIQVAKESEGFEAKSHKQKLAHAGESFARKYLEDLGWSVRERNWRSGRLAEIDIIAVDKTNSFVFVEVKARRENGKEPGFILTGFDSIDGRKKRKIVTGALHYLAKHKLAEHKYRFDAIVLYYPELETLSQALYSAVPRLFHVQDIF